MTRAKDYGMVYAKVIECLISTIPEEKRGAYKERFISEIKNYSLKPKRKEDSSNPEDRCELANIVDNFDIENPEHFARFVKEGLHLMYQKNTASNVINELIKEK